MRLFRLAPKAEEGPTLTPLTDEGAGLRLLF